MARPVLLLGVEGVLRPFDLNEPPPGFVPHGSFPGEEIVVINPQHGIWVEELASRYEVVWVSPWSDDANRLFAPLLDIDPVAILATPDQPDDDGDRTVRVVSDFVGTRAACWIDEVHGRARSAWAERRDEPTLLLTTTPELGFGREQVDAALVWAAGVSSRSTVG